MIVSVPHNGTRSLMKVVKSSAYKHFGMHQPEIDMYPLSEWSTDPLHIPIREPYQVSCSWMYRYLDEVGKQQQDLCNLWDKMLAFIKRASPKVHRIEDYNYNEGSLNLDSEYVLTEDRLLILREWMTGERLEFYRKYYPLDWL